MMPHNAMVIVSHMIPIAFVIVDLKQYLNAFYSKMEIPTLILRKLINLLHTDKRQDKTKTG